MANDLTPQPGAIAALFGAGGALARGVDGYAPRDVQRRMAEAVAQALARQETLAVEAGTGTGKTFAYLVPALLSGQRTVISTGTLNLQDQLFYRDLPRVREALGSPARVVLLKGRANYVCLHRLDRAAQGPAGRHEQRTLQALQQWARITTTGELQEVPALAQDDPLLPRVSSTADNCVGAKCADFERCFVVQARRNAQTADVVVVNHHLLFADFTVKEEGFGRILPGADAVIVDEAHQLPELCGRFFGVRVSTRQLMDLAQDAATEAQQLGDVPALRDAAAVLAEGVAALERCFAGNGARERLEAFLARAGAREALDAAVAALEALGEVLAPLAERTPGLEAARDRGAALAQQLGELRQQGDERVAWVEATGRGGSLHSTPVRVDRDFQRLRESHPGAWVFTSATLAAGEDFSHFRNQLGLDDARELKLDSPFDFEQQARLYLPSGLPDPNDPQYTARVLATVIPLIEASGGGAFLLCTSHRAVREAAERLRRELHGLPLFVQGEGGRKALLDAFTGAGNGVLVGTSSFWEGVDVRGLALRMVIIDKLPFAAPGDPVFEARLQAIRASGEDPFLSHQLPQAIMALRQGCGRLIRDPSDRGLLVLCDPRLRTRGYGGRILESLPPLPVIETLAEARSWLQVVGRAA
ncbi:MAG TPA: ATP-dependent DNA helicase [Candidatus Binatia bacterium]|nr:ATP-dependent DNA helicase [Candidatus Binatia bacterium]